MNLHPPATQAELESAYNELRTLMQSERWRDIDYRLAIADPFRLALIQATVRRKRAKLRAQTSVRESRAKDWSFMHDPLPASEDRKRAASGDHDI